MAKVSFTGLKLKVKDEVKTFTIGEKEIEVKQYLPAEEKNTLIEVSLQEAAKGTIFNTHLMEVFFHVYLVMEYTNLNFTDTQKADLLKLYDILETNGIIEKVVSNIPESEYNYLVDELETMSKGIMKYMISAKAIADDLMQYAPVQSSQIVENIANLDLDKFQQIMGIAQDTNFK